MYDIYLHLTFFLSFGSIYLKYVFIFNPSSLIRNPIVSGLTRYQLLDCVL